MSFIHIALRVAMIYSLIRPRLNLYVTIAAEVPGMRLKGLPNVVRHWRAALSAF